MLKYTRKITIIDIILLIVCITVAASRLTRFLWEQKPLETSYISLNVKGKIPSWVNGTFINNVPAILKGEKSSIGHWFDGLAMLQAFYIKDGKVQYKSRFLHSEAYKSYQNSGKFDFTGFAQKSKIDQFSFIEFIFGPKKHLINNANVNVARINKRLVALTELPLPVEFDLELNTLGVLNYKDKLPKKYTMESAHPLQDPDNQNIWNYLIKIGIFNNFYQIYAISHELVGRKLISSIPVSTVSYMHSFSITEDYFILIDYPLRSKKPRDLAKGFIQTFSWQKDEPTHVYVVNKKNGNYKIFKTNPFFSFHHVNAFQEDGKIFVDLIIYPSDRIINEVNNYPFLSNVTNKLVRLTIDLTYNQATTFDLTQEKLEFPRINAHFTGKKYNYFYAVKFTSTGNGLIKYNHTGLKNLIWFEPGCYANEPIFIARPGTNVEDDGVILSIINDLQTNKSFLLVLNAINFEEIARITVPYLLPFGLHGQFFPTE
jgi:carotenoid cleavage dioxygenase-like enzyme